MAEETVYHQDQNVTITNARVVIGAKTYAMANITSVSMSMRPAQTGCATWTLVGGLAAALFFGWVSHWLTGVVIAVVTIAAAFYLAKQAKPSYLIRPGSASGETDVFASYSREYIQTLVDRINQAIIVRG